MKNKKLRIITNRLLISILLIFTGSLSALCQNYSFEEMIKKNGDEKISSLENWAYNYLFFKKPADKKKSLDEFEILAKKNNDKITSRTIEFYRAYYTDVLDSNNFTVGIKKMTNIIKETEKEGSTLQAAYFKHVIGYYFFTSKTNYVLALQNMLQAHYEFNKTDYRNIFDSSGMLERLAYLYFHLNNFNESIKYFKLSTQYSNKNIRKKIDTLNAIGQCYREIFELDSAKVYFKKARLLAIQAKDTAWIGISSNDIGSMYLNENKVKHALPFIEESYKYAKLTNNDILIAEALTNLGKIELLSGNSNKALELLNEADLYFSRNEKLSFEDFKRKENFYHVFSQIYENKGKTFDALKNLKKSNAVKDSILKRSILSNNIAINQSFEAEQNNNKLKILANEKNAAVLKQKFFLLIGILLSIIIILLYGRQKRNKKLQYQKQKLLNLKNEQTQNDLKQANELLNEYLNNLKDKTHLLELTQNELIQIKDENKDSTFDHYKIIQKLNQSTILTDEDWVKFKNLFEKVHLGFFSKLKATYPKLTPAETRLIALIKLGLSSHEMASMMGISIMGIKKNRQRLRKKINLNEEEKIEKIFENF